jgi:acetylornithine/succinyldiaminopimelate/putrescine aminotransferase
MGSLFAYEQYGVEPDIMTLAKGLGSGVPIGAFLAKERVSVFAPGEHGSTFGGSPLICAASLASLKFIIENDIPDHVKKIGQYFINGLKQLEEQFSFVNGVRGSGLLLALSFTKNIAPEIVLDCLKEGLLVNPVKPNAIRFMPPLVIAEKDVDEALGIIKTVFKRRLKNGR